MGFFDSLFHSSKEPKFKSEHSVIVHFTYYKEDLNPLHEFEKILEEAIKQADVGEYDGHEIAMDLSDGFLYMYGPNAEALFKVVKPHLEKNDFTRGSLAVLRFGGPGTGAKELEIDIEK